MRLFTSSRNQTGSVAVIVALLLTLLLGVMALSMDTGYFYLKKNQYQNAVEAAALAAVQKLCDGDPEAVARAMAETNGIPGGEAGGLVVEVGFYDEKDEYGDFEEYTDFASNQGASFPGDEYDNAVLVRFQHKEQTLSGLHEDATITAAAVAFIKRYGLVATGGADSENGSEIRLGPNTKFSNGDVYCNGDIKYTQYYSDGTPFYSPVFENSDLRATGQVLAVPVTTSFLGPPTVHWDQGTPSNLPNTYSGVPEHIIRPLDDAYFEELKQEADVVYTPADAGKDDIFYTPYKFDLTGIKEHRVIFFDSPNTGNVYLGKLLATGHTFKGDTMKNVTFITQRPIMVYHSKSSGFTLHLGAPGDEQLVLISGGNISFKGSGIEIDGTIFRTKKNFDLTSELIFENDASKMRVISDGDIKIRDTPTKTEHSANSEFDFHFGPPCPPSIPLLGRLVKTSGG